MSDLLCQLRDIRKTYKVGDIEVEALKGVSLDIGKGEFLAIMGASGSGKTTLMNIIGLLDVPTSGSYLFDNRDVTTLSDDELSSLRNMSIGFVFQNFYLLPYATVLENVLLPTIYGEGKRGDGKKRARDVLRMVGIEEQRRFRPTQLSGGQQQRVAIARALINDPELILADEPTGQLDSKTAEQIMNIFVELNRSGKTIVLITHDPNIASYANRIVFIKDGKIVEE